MLDKEAVDGLHALSMEEAMEFYSKWNTYGWDAIAELGRKDLFYLLVFLLHRRDAVHPWIYARCREFEAKPDGHLDLWAREHYKSTIITFAGTIQEILKDPEITVGIFSHNRATATKFLVQIQREFEGNEQLKRCYRDVLWDNPARESPRWSEQKGIVVRRKTNPREATVEANGLVDGMPTGMHYRLRIYDDVVTQDSVTTPEMIEKTTQMWQLSQSLGADGGRVRYIGTRYHFNDTYRVMLDQNSAIPRIYPATDNGKSDGEPVLISREYLNDKRRDQGPYVFSCQMLLNPVAEEAQGFNAEWVKYYDNCTGDGMNKYILVDPANEKKKSSDYTAMFVVGLSSDKNYYILDIVRERMNLTERADMLFRLHRSWRPIGVGYEKYGKDSDIQHFEYLMSSQNYHFNITPLGGMVKKEDRIRKLIPIFEQGRVYFPEVYYYTDNTGRKRDLVKDFIDQELKGFPVAIHDDMLDCLARILDQDFPTIWPAGEGDRIKKRERYLARPTSNRTWMSH